ncbi:hypothetical protein [Desulfovibrio ferrophilus]|uniref:HET domain protein pin-c3 n=1 Tax=Desulfovibrio ferrophilus TaxID=241368 RepID=A0A2Z6B292_9BACT|nr:hypothetical protein [Desulfovibrio ferrophilus]BBD09558.1 HET domain protein pin-c3 [Desulfovibrio ferrophilus]
MPTVFFVLLLCSLALPVWAGELVVDNFSEQETCCVTFETWRMGTVETRTVCAEPQRRERFGDGLAAIGKIKGYCQGMEKTVDSSIQPDVRFLPEGIYSPLSSYRVEMNPEGQITVSEIK